MFRSTVSFFRSAIARRFAAVIDGLCGTIAWHAGAHHADAGEVTYAHGRLRRILTQLDRLAQRFQAGLPMQRTPAAPRTATTTATTTTKTPSKTPVRRGKGWLVRLVQGTTAYIAEIQAALADPDTIALLEASPQARRLIRPLCHMLLIKPTEAMALPPRPRPPRKKKRRKRKKTARASRRPAWWPPQLPHRKRPAPD